MTSLVIDLALGVCIITQLVFVQRWVRQVMTQLAVLSLVVHAVQDQLTALDAERHT